MEPIKFWRKDGFTLRIWDTFKQDCVGKSVLRYEFKDGRKIIFAGADFACGASTPIDSLDCVYDLLGFFALREGDTDREYFDSYTGAQIDWRDSGRAEYLGTLVYDWEQRKAA
jgi:hypothetical protein